MSASESGNSSEDEMNEGYWYESGIASVMLLMIPFRLVSVLVISPPSYPFQNHR